MRRCFALLYTGVPFLPLPPSLSPFPALVRVAAAEGLPTDDEVGVRAVSGRDVLISRFIRRRALPLSLSLSPVCELPSLRGRYVPWNSRLDDGENVSLIKPTYALLIFAFLTPRIFKRVTNRGGD